MVGGQLCTQSDDQTDDQPDQDADVGVVGVFEFLFTEFPHDELCRQGEVGGQCLKPYEEDGRCVSLDLKADSNVI